MESFEEFNKKYSYVLSAIWNSFANKPGMGPYGMGVSQCRYLINHCNLTTRELNEFLIMLRNVMKEKCEIVKLISNDSKDGDIVVYFTTNVPDIEKLYENYLNEKRY